ncbi:cytochrome-c peroxidase [Luteithermobacter gelatinilyticus]|uniref:cytochrome-c peroxidase n=1 Tax=Luteithermobacter gelatinilyticus TaxID=2582913 RepID=UPI001105B306|nr:cytochrome-c peroxidase [Luteithermobacter gelatinilyticus]
MKLTRLFFFFLTYLTVFLTAFSVQADDLLREARDYFSPLPEKAPARPDNPITPEKVALGKMLYFEPRLSKSWVFSCNSCHNVATAGVDMRPKSIGHRWQLGGRNSPTVLNAVFNESQFWDGRAETLEEQAKGPITNPVEMAHSEEMAVKTLSAIPAYVERFKAAFPDEQNPLTYTNAAKAIAAFEAAELRTPDAPFDQYLKGDTNALTAQQKRGLRAFMDYGCTACHSGVNLGGNGFFRFGVFNLPDEQVLPRNDKGLQDLTGDEADAYVFRTPTLRNVALTAPYFHSGAVWDLGEAVRIMAESQLGETLTNNEVADIVAFLESLTGKQPEIALPVLPIGPATMNKPDEG